MTTVVTAASPEPEFARKIVARDRLAMALAALPRPLVFTNGCFDIVHAGHVTYLAQARALGASLLVALNSDMSVRAQNKGSDRPFNDERERALVLAALESVGCVVIFDDPVPEALLRSVRPEIYAKGGDWNIEKIAERKVIAEWDGLAVSVPFIYNRSTTQLVDRIRKARQL